MKKLLLFTACILIFTGVNAQILPTQNFESWGSGSPPEATGWASGNILYGFGAGDTVCHKSTSANTGSYAMKLETIKQVTNNAASIGVPDTLCFAFTGTINPFPASIKTGYAFTARPSLLEFYYKYTPVGSDSATAGIILTKSTGGNTRDTVASGKIYLGAQGSYTMGTINLTYTPSYVSSGNPDTAFIYFASSYVKSFIIANGQMNIQYKGQQIGSMLWVDDWYPTSVGIEEQQLIKYSAYPVPANDQYTLHFEKAESKTVQVYDVAGKLMEEIKSGDKLVTIKTSAYADGIYFIRVKDAGGKSSPAEKFVVSH
jgi:hypothetical protein